MCGVGTRKVMRPNVRHCWCYDEFRELILRITIMLISYLIMSTYFATGGGTEDG